MVQQSETVGVVRQNWLGRALRWFEGSRTALPGRIAAEIDRREAAAERTIGWAQLGFVLFYSVLFAIAPQAEGATMASQVPLTLGAYMIFTLFRLWLSYAITLPVWFVIFSILVDVTLLCALIFSFHIQYSQPPAFYLKAPTIIHFFSFISLRVLRYDPRFVLIAGLASAAGWLGMMGYALMSDMGEMYVTRNYVDYLTSNAILIGAEVDKVLTIIAVTLILAFALYRARGVLLDAVASRSAADDLSRFFAPEVARSITQSEMQPSAGLGEQRAAAILFVDLRNFTATAATMDPGRVMAVLARYQSEVMAVIAAHGGRVDKFLGDGVLATFGAVADSPTHAADALRAARQVITALDAGRQDFAALGWPGDWCSGTAVAAGTVTVGVVGAEGHFEFTVIGDAVNRAAKFEAANKVLGSRALTDRATWNLAVSQGYEAQVPWDHTSEQESGEQATEAQGSGQAGAAAFRPAQPVLGLPGRVDLILLA
ncbi:MAG: adenylate/guanylate cyclase domain-containing protein [Pseudorhodobacter sp.]